MKEYSVLFNQKETITISANNEEDARQAARKMPGYITASVLRHTNKPVHPHSNKGYISKDAAHKEAFTSAVK